MAVDRQSVQDHVDRAVAVEKAGSDFIPPGFAFFFAALGDGEDIVGLLFFILFCSLWFDVFLSLHPS
ncbi:MAG TPA: hypothetical protein DF383_07280 [Deltaproteobacteria bacterium]|nr:hypothetical protein [Deltaproteobacteria bacterium]